MSSLYRAWKCAGMAARHNADEPKRQITDFMVRSSTAQLFFSITSAQESSQKAGR